MTSGLRTQLARLFFIGEAIGRMSTMRDTPLVALVRRGRTTDVASLLAGGADANEPSTDGTGATALLVASEKGHTKIVKKLLAAKADVNRAANDGATPLFVAAWEGHTEIVTKLLAANANVDQATKEGHTHPGSTPLLVACRSQSRGRTPPQTRT